MSATNKTPNLDLPQWIAGDQIEREDFNAAFDKLDAVNNKVTFTSVTLQNGWTGSLHYAVSKAGWGVLQWRLTPGTKTVTTVVAQLPSEFAIGRSVAMMSVRTDNLSIEGAFVLGWDGYVRVGATNPVTAIWDGMLVVPIR